MIPVHNLIDEFESITEYWSPKVIGQVNDQYVKVAKALGELVWHQHDDQDELFYVLKGTLVIEFESESVSIDEGGFCVVPKGVMHHPTAAEECWMALIETVTTEHTGHVESTQTKTIEQQLS